MKEHPLRLLFCLILALPVLFAGLGCKKDTKPPAPAVVRNVRYILYTLKDFSKENGLITFEVIMKNGTKVLFDSAFAQIKISAIPDKAHAIVINKTVPVGNENADLTVGFLYAIENVGNSWYLDSSKAPNPMKFVEYAFQ